LADALRQQEQARLLEQTEHLNQQARVAAARAKTQADQEIAEMEHSLDLKKAELKQLLLEKESALTSKVCPTSWPVTACRLAFEIEELGSAQEQPGIADAHPSGRPPGRSEPEPQERPHSHLPNSPGSHARFELLNLFQDLLQKSPGSQKKPAVSSNIALEPPDPYEQEEKRFHHNPAEANRGTKGTMEHEGLNIFFSRHYAAGTRVPHRVLRDEKPFSILPS